MPPKQKKQPRNAYYFYMVKRKHELELEGHRFPGGMKDVAHVVGPEWARLTPEMKLPFEEEARKSKEEGKYDLTNKFTSTGESYDQIQRRKQNDMQSIEEQENYVTELGVGDGALDRVFVLMKTIHCVEQIIERNERIFWPIEIGLTAFSLREGLKSLYWTLVDTQKTPVGYASAAKECSEETGLPEPGMAVMAEYRDYNKIMKNVQGFIKTWTKQGYRNGPVVFCMDQETNHAQGCLRWLAAHCDEDRRREHQIFVDALKFYKLPKLILRLATYANQLDPDGYTNILTMHKLEHSAASIVNKGCYDYKDEITCEFHTSEKGSLKMFTCCRNVCLRRMFLLFEEFLPAFGLEKTDRHDMNKLKEAQEAKKRAARFARPVPAPVPFDINPPPTSASDAPESKIKTSAPWGKRRDTDVEEEDVSFRAKRRRSGDFEDLHEPPRRISRTDDRGSPSPPATTYKRLPPEPESISRSTADSISPPRTDVFGGPSTIGAAFVPWGRKPTAPEANFGNDDFPALGSNPSKDPPKRPMGRGRGSINPQDEYGNDDGWDKSGKSYY